MKRYFALLIIMLFRLILLAQEADDRGYIVEVGDPVPEFEMVLADGSKVSMSDLEGKVVMLQFTASWCKVCREEMPYIEKDIWLPYKDKGLVLIGIDRDESLETVIAFAKKMKISYPLALDPNADIFGMFADKKAGVTRNVIIDRSGKIVYLTRLFNLEEFYKMRNKIDELIRQ
jgi:peroxiredoxin